MTHSTNSRVLVVDVETAPNLAWVWQLFDANVSLNQLVQSGGILSWSAKWHEEPYTYFDSVWTNDAEGMMSNLWVLMDDADAVVGWNSNRFDIRHINAEFAKQGWGPPSPYKKIDLMQTVRRHMKFPSNKLDYVSQALGVGRKLETGGFELWTDVMSGNKKAQRLMQDYNVQDVELTEMVYDKLRAWIAPAVNKSIEQGHVCPECGSRHLQSRGYRYNVSAKYKRWHCQSCGSWSQSVTGEKLDRTQMLKKETI